MRRVFCSLSIAAIAFAISLWAQQSPHRPPADPSEPARLPNGKLQQDEIVKADHEKNIADARELVRLSTELKDEVEKTDPFVLSVGAIKKTEEIEKLSKRIRSRIRHF